MKHVIRQGLLTGCLKRCSGSSWSQYSSSHSTGKSTSKLDTAVSKNCFLVAVVVSHSSSWIAQGRPSDELTMRSMQISTLEKIKRV